MMKLEQVRENGAVDSRLARPAQCDTEPRWWWQLATKARISTDFNGKNNWKICLSRLIAAGFAELKCTRGRYDAVLTPRGEELLEGDS